jgi:hypothetical protein
MGEKNKLYIDSLLVRNVSSNVNKPIKVKQNKSDKTIPSYEYNSTLRR